MSGHRIHLPEVPSTNSYTTELLSHSDITPWSVITTDFQTAGRGQRGKQWQSERGKNLLCTIVLEPELSVDHQYLISVAVSLAVCDVLHSLGVEANVKWPNDIMVGDKKICGFLIENAIKGQRLERSIVGIGWNINQSEFSPFDWPATSVIRETSKVHSVEDLLGALLDVMRLRVSQCSAQPKGLISDFEKRLFKKGEEVTFTSEGKELRGRILSVEPSGRLVLQVGDQVSYHHQGEIRLKRTSL